MDGPRGRICRASARLPCTVLPALQTCSPVAPAPCTLCARCRWPSVSPEPPAPSGAAQTTSQESEKLPKTRGHGPREDLERAF